MSCMNFEQAYSGQITSGDIRPHMSLTILVIGKYRSIIRKSDGYSSSNLQHNYVSNKFYKIVTNLATCWYYVRYRLPFSPLISPIKTDR